MERDIITPDSHEHWLSLREADITSTEVSALFGCSPYATEYELYHLKKGNIEDSFQDNDRTKWGRRLEASIAEGIAEDLGLVVEPFKVYVRIPEHRMGSSFDFKVIGLREDWNGSDETFRDMFREHGPGIIEIKNVDGMVFRKTWIDGEENAEAPPHIEMQVQHQLECADMPWSIIAPLINGNTPKPILRIRDTEIGDIIRQRIAQFWERYDNDEAPEPNFDEDAAAIARLYQQDDDTEVDLSDDRYLAELCEEERKVADTKKWAEARQKAIKAEILTIIGAVRKAVVGPYNVNAKTRQGSEGRMLTDEDLGTRVGGSQASEYLKISRITRKENPGKLVTENMIGERVGQREPWRFPQITEPKSK